MKKVLFILIGVMLSGAATAACPTNYQEIHMENMVLVTGGASCPAGTVSYYKIDEMCNTHIH